MTGEEAYWAGLTPEEPEDQQKEELVAIQPEPLPAEDAATMWTPAIEAPEPERPLLRNHENFDCIVAVGHNGVAVLLEGPDKLVNMLEVMELHEKDLNDEGFDELPEAPGVYRIMAEFWATPGDCFGSEAAFGYKVTGWNKVDVSESAAIPAAEPAAIPASLSEHERTIIDAVKRLKRADDALNAALDVATEQRADRQMRERSKAYNDLMSLILTLDMDFADGEARDHAAE